MSKSSGNILLVDDNETNIQVLASLLHSHHYELEFATSGKEALEWCSDTYFDLILLDIMMPEMDGYEVCQKLKSDPLTAAIPVIFITAKNDNESINLGFDAGAVDYVTKPFKAKELLSRISVHISLRKSQSESLELYNELKHKNDDILESYNSGKLLQTAVLPSEIEMYHVFPEHFVFYRPCAGIGGDFYWMHRISTTKIAFCVGDCTGHGIPGALMSMFGIGQLHAIIGEMKTESPAEILSELRNRITVHLHQNEDNASNSIDMSMAIIDTEKKCFTFSTADMPIILLTTNDLSSISDATPKSRTIMNANRNDTLYFIDQNTSTVGFDLFETEYNDTVLSYNSGDTLIFFSDGFKDQFGGSANQKFSKQRFIEIINNVSILPMEMQGHLLTREFDEWKNVNDQTDDVMIVGIELN